MSLQEAIDDVIKGSRRGSEMLCEKHKDAFENEPKRKVREKSMTKEEREEYRQKKMLEEEARYLKKEKKSRKIYGSTAKIIPEKKERVKKIRTPKILQPLQPLYLLKIPGLPKGDCLAICLAHGADQS